MRARIDDDENDGDHRPAEASRLERTSHSTDPANQQTDPTGNLRPERIVASMNRLRPSVYQRTDSHRDPTRRAKR